MSGGQAKSTAGNPADERREPQGGGRMRLTPGELAALSTLSAVICTFAAAVGLVAFFTKGVAATLLVSAIALAVLLMGTVGVMRGPHLSRKLNVPVYLLAIGVAAVIAASFGGYSLRGSPASLTSPTTAAAPLATPTGPVTTSPDSTAPAPPPTPTVYHVGTLTLPAGYNASLDAPRSSNWDIAKNENWPPGDMYYDASTDTIEMANAPNTTAALGTRFAWDFRTCLTAGYGSSANAPQYTNISPGHGLCFKTPDDRLALLKVVSKTTSQVVLSVEVWQPIGT